MLKSNFRMLPPRKIAVTADVLSHNTLVDFALQASYLALYHQVMAHCGLYLQNTEYWKVFRSLSYLQCLLVFILSSRHALLMEEGVPQSEVEHGVCLWKSASLLKDLNCLPVTLPTGKGKSLLPIVVFPPFLFSR